MYNNENKRIFVAVALPPQVQQELSRIITLLKKERLCEGNYVNPYMAHITVQFIGSVPQHDIAAIQTALQAVTYTQFTATLDSLGFFVKRERIAIIYASMKSEGLQALAALVQRAVMAWLEQAEKQQFVAHLTLLRVKKVYDEHALRNFLTTIKIQPTSWTIDSFLLMESVLTPEGPIYTLLQEYALM